MWTLTASSTTCRGDAAIEIAGTVSLLSIRMGVSFEERNRGLERRSEAADDCAMEATTGMGRTSTPWTLSDFRRSWVRSASRFETGIGAHP